MRGNGLYAASYIPLADLDPRAADALLEMLGNIGVAAYAEPSQGHQGPYLDVHLPTRPSDRLYVDQAQRKLAHTLLVEQLPQLRGLIAAGPASASIAATDPPMSTAEDEAWERIVGAFDRPSGDPVPPWPVQEDVDATTYRDREEEPPAAELDRLREEQSSVLDRDEHFVPPEPPPLPRLDPITRLAWTAMLGGPALLLVATLAGQALPRFLVALAVLAFIGGFVTLVARMKNPREDDWGADGGAVV